MNLGYYWKLILSKIQLQSHKRLLLLSSCNIVEWNFLRRRTFSQGEGRKGKEKNLRRGVLRLGYYKFLFSSLCVGAVLYHLNEIWEPSVIDERRAPRWGGGFGNQVHQSGPNGIKDSSQFNKSFHSWIKLSLICTIKNPEPTSVH